VNKRIAPFGHFAVDHLFIVVYESVAFPVGGAPQLAGGPRVVEADEEVVDICGLVPPNHVKTIQLPRGTIGVEFSEQTRAIGD